MRILHTSDWHVGRTVSRTGRSRDDEHRAVFAEMADLVRDEKVDLVLVAGDIFDHQAPNASAEDVVYEALLGFTRAGAQVVMIGGNHDHPDRLEAVRPLLKLANIHAAAKIRPPEDGGCIDISAGGDTARIALLPWPSRSRIVTADDLMSGEAADNQSIYRDRCARVLGRLCGGFRAETINLILAHLVVTGATLGGGERQSETIEDYWVTPDTLNLNAQYVALGHIHKPQDLGRMWPVRYCGSPLQLDFGEENDTKGVVVFDAKPGLPVRDARFVELKTGRRMLTLRGSVQQLTSPETIAKAGDAFLRVYVSDPARAGLADEVRAALPNAVHVHIDMPQQREAAPSTREGMQPRELLAAYFEQARVNDEGALALFDELLEEEYAAP